MKTPAKIVIILLVVVAAAAAIILKGNKSRNAGNFSTRVAATTAESSVAAASDAAAKLPKLLDLGATKCIPCKMMAPILEELKKEYADKLKVEFIDVWQNEEAGKQYGVEMIPTQIFFDANDKELFRHTGFLARKTSSPSGRNWAWTSRAASRASASCGRHRWLLTPDRATVCVHVRRNCERQNQDRGEGPNRAAVMTMTQPLEKR